MPLDDELVNRVCWKIPNALALVGSRSGDEWNAMTTTWITQVSMAPVLIGVGVSTPAQAVEACTVADGVVVGSALVRRLVEGASVAEAADLVGTFRNALDGGNA